MNRSAEKAERPNIIVLMTDRLHIGYFGAYGNSWIGTETFDRLSFESVLFDQYHASSLSLPELFRAFWSGTEPVSGTADPKQDQLPLLLKKFGGYRTLFLTDNSGAAGEAESAGFAEVRLLPASSGNEEPAETPEETAFCLQMTQIAETAEQLAESSKPFFLWVHLSGFGGAWDFPIADREEAREDEDDPDPYPETAVPFCDFTGEPNPDFDQIRSITETYAAGIRLWDAALEILTSFLDESGLFDRTAFLLGGVRGFPLGEHKRVGIASEYAGSLYSEEIHLPLLFRFPNGEYASVRSSALCGPDDLFRTLCASAGISVEKKTLLDIASEEAESIRETLILTEKDASSSRRGLITDQWHYLRDDGQTPIKREIYLRPNDRWEVNEVADRCGEETINELERFFDLRGFS